MKKGNNFSPCKLSSALPCMNCTAAFAAQLFEVLNFEQVNSTCRPKNCFLFPVRSSVRIYILNGRKGRYVKKKSKVKPFGLRQILF